MSATTEIGWTDATFNPWWGCTRVSPGCEHCYAETFSKRVGQKVWGKNAERRFFGDKHWAEPVKWNAKAEAAGERRRVFCASMADVFEDRPELNEHRMRLFDLITHTPALDWQLLTKRPENVVDLMPFDWHQLPSNVWLGVTVEDQERADERIPVLAGIPASVRFLSCEPLLGPVNLLPWLRRISDEAEAASPYSWDTSHRIGWVIAGGESGPGHRAPNSQWFRDIRDVCHQYGVPFFFKQVGGATPKAGGKLLDGREHCEFPAPSITQEGQPNE